MTSQALVSIIMPAYNAEKFIVDSINSVKQQSYSNWELIIIDDGSSDHTAGLAIQEKEKDSRIIYQYQSNSKLPNARNAGLRIATGEFVAFLDSDDLWDKDKLKLQLTAMDEHKVDVVYTSGYIFYEGSDELHPYPTKAGFFSGEEMFQLEYTRNVIPVLSVLTKSEIIKKTGEFDSSLILGCEDWDYWLRMAKSGAIFLGLENKLFYYRRHSNNMSSNILSMRMAEAAIYIKNIDFLFLTKEFIFKKFDSFLYPLALDLLRVGRIDDAKRIANSLKTFAPSFKSYYLHLAIMTLGKFALGALTLAKRFTLNSK